MRASCWRALPAQKLNADLVKAFVNAITFFPLGCVVRTNRDEIGVVVRTNHADPLHPMLTLVDANQNPSVSVDTCSRDGSGGYERHILETIRPPEGLEMSKFLAAAA